MLGFRKRLGLTPGATRNVSVGVASTEVVAANEPRPFGGSPGRQGLSIVNDSTASIYLALGQAAVLHKDIYLAPGGSWNGRVSGVLWTGAVFAIATAAASNVVVVEL